MNLPGNEEGTVVQHTWKEYYNSKFTAVYREALKFEMPAQDAGVAGREEGGKGEPADRLVHPEKEKQLANKVLMALHLASPLKDAVQDILPEQEIKIRAPMSAYANQLYSPLTRELLSLESPAGDLGYRSGTKSNFR